MYKIRYAACYLYVIHMSILMYICVHMYILINIYTYIHTNTYSIYILLYTHTQKKRNWYLCLPPGWEIGGAKGQG